MLELRGLRKCKDNIVRTAHDALHAKFFGEADTWAEELLVPAQEARRAAERHAREDVHPHCCAEDEAAALGEAKQCEVGRLAIFADGCLYPVARRVQELPPCAPPAGKKKGGYEMQACHCVAFVQSALLEQLGLLEKFTCLLVQPIVQLLG